MKRVIYIIGVATLFILFLLSCDDNSINEHIDEDTPECPPIDIVSTPPYNSPVWHPSGKFIVFNYTPLDSITYPYGEHCFGIQHFNYDSTGFWLVDIDGKNKRRILKYQLQTPAWSPKGDWVAFVLDAQIYKMPFNIAEEKLDTTRLEQLTFEGRNFFPSWSPDGEWIAFSKSICEGPKTCGIWLMQSTGNLNRFIASYGTHPTWNPLKEEILYLARAVTSSGQVLGDSLWIFEIQTGNIHFHTFLFGENYDNRYPKFSPNGNTIAFSSRASGGSYFIYTMDKDGSNIKQLTLNEGFTCDWDSDSEKIVYTRFNSRKSDKDNGVLWIIDIKTKKENQLTFNVKRR